LQERAVTFPPSIMDEHKHELVSANLQANTMLRTFQLLISPVWQRTIGVGLCFVGVDL
jgi:hypothetical protein